MAQRHVPERNVRELRPDLRARRYDVPSCRPHARPLRLDAAVYRRRRLRVGAATTIAVAALGLGVQAIVSDSGGGPASAAGVGSLTGSERTVVARPGDTLWAIARAHHGDVGFRRYLDAL